MLVKTIKSPTGKDVPMLTKRHLEILQLMCQGLASSQIARRLGLGNASVKHYRSEMLERTGCLTSGHLCAFAVSNGHVTAITNSLPAPTSHEPVASRIRADQQSRAVVGS